MIDLGNEIRERESQAIVDHSMEPGDWPAGVRAKLDELWRDYRSVYRTEYHKRLRHMLADHHEENGTVDDEDLPEDDSTINLIDDFPVNGLEHRYNIDAVEDFLLAIDTSNAHTVLKSTRQYGEEQQDGDEDDEHDGDIEEKNDTLSAESHAIEDGTARSDPQDQTLMQKIRKAFFHMGSTTADAITLCSQLNSKGRATFACRPHHTWYKAKCPCCGKSLWQAAKIAVYGHCDTPSFTSRTINLFKTHVQQYWAQRSLENVSDRLLAEFPSRLPALPVVLNKREPLTRAHSAEDGSQNLYEVSRWLALRDNQQCAKCTFNTPHVGLFKAHCLTVHGIWLPAADNTWIKKPWGSAYVKGEWSTLSARFPTPRWSWHDRSYHPDPKELELFSESYFKERILHPAQGIKQFGIRPDIEITTDQLQHDQTGTEIDYRYVLKQARGAEVEQEALCFLCVWNVTKTWTERINPIDAGHSASAVHNRTCLCEALYGIDLLFEDLRVRAAGGDPDADRLAAKQAKAKAKNAKSKAKRNGAEIGDSQDGVDEQADALDQNPSTKKTRKVSTKVKSNVPTGTSLDDQDTTTLKGGTRIPRSAKPKAPYAPLSTGPSAFEVAHLVVDGYLACPDSVCRAHGQRSTSQVDWIRHLVGVHHFHLFSASLEQQNLDHLAFKDDAELDAFRGLKQEKEKDNDQS